MLVLDSPQIVQETIARWKSQGNTISLVPTMGCLHAGHLQLVKAAKGQAKKSVVSIFVNPLQFGAGEDFERYPRTLDNDLRLLREENVDLVFTPKREDLYPFGFNTQVEVGGLAEALCGKSRPGHFTGVATVCLKLFNITLADVAVFGQKDYQQLQVVTRMVADLNLPIRILPHETVREADGLAMSSRNRYLSEQERNMAARIPDVLRRADALVKEKGAASVGEIKQLAREILGQEPSVDYVEVASERNLEPLDDSVGLASVTDPHLFLAVQIGSTRLIDNASLKGCPQ